jgi:hypothetical protein
MNSIIEEGPKLKKDSDIERRKKSRVQEKQIKLANCLLDEILVCLNAHIHEVSTHPLDETVKSIVYEIFRYKEYCDITR